MEAIGIAGQAARQGDLLAVLSTQVVLTMISS